MVAESHDRDQESRGTEARERPVNFVKSRAYSYTRAADELRTGLTKDVERNRSVLYCMV